MNNPKDRPAGSGDVPSLAEIEITPEMIEAGGRVYWRETDARWEEIVSEIYCEMERARIKSAPSS